LLHFTFKTVWQRTRRRPTPGMLREPIPPAECLLRCLPMGNVPSVQKMTLGAIGAKNT
jgi:hypothetical protein